MDKPVKVTRRTMTDAWRKRQPFEGSNIKGIAGPVSNLGRLPDIWRDQYKADEKLGITFTVVSYDTPIAWVVNGKERVPPVRYSVTTTKQQGLLF